MLILLHALCGIFIRVRADDPSFISAVRVSSQPQAENFPIAQARPYRLAKWGVMQRASGNDRSGEIMISKLAGASLVALALGSCASGSDKIKATYVSPVQYASYSCRQIGEESQRLSSRAAQAAGVQDSKRTSDAVATTVGVIVFWPALFFIDGDNQQTAELARLKGEMEALEQASIQKNCGIQFRRAAGS